MPSTILIVEDEPLLAMVLEDAFINAGFHVLIATNGARAVDCFSSQRTSIDGVVTDIRMPGVMDGWEVARRIRYINRTLPVIYLTANSASDWALNGVEGSALFFKPQASEAVVTAISQMIEAH